MKYIENPLTKEKIVPVSIPRDSERVQFASKFEKLSLMIVSVLGVVFVTLSIGFTSLHPGEYLEQQSTNFRPHVKQNVKAEQIPVIKKAYKEHVLEKRQ